MRVVHAAAFTAAAMLLASFGSAQGIGSAAAREREKRKTEPAKPVKVYTEGDLGPSIVAPAPSSGEPTPATSGAGAPGEGTASAPAGTGTPSAPAGTPAEGAAPGEGGAGAEPDPAKSEADAAQAAAEQQAKAQEAWRKQIEQARKEEQVYREVIDKLQLDLNDASGGYFGPGRASKLAFLDENKQKLSEAQARIATLESEGRRNNYR
jgi:hypothetical protein